MKYVLVVASLCLLSTSVYSQLIYEASSVHPFGLPNPAALHVTDFKEMIGVCPCKSVQRNPDGTWQDTIDMSWKFKYILNGTAIQDETWREETDFYATSIRQFYADSGKWIVSYSSYPAISFSPGIWKGSRKEGKIILTRPQKAPNGMDGFSQLTFFDISPEGWKWKGEWVKDDHSVTWPFWTIL
ncbi:MAG: hypothetical protein OEQ53_08860, partial [Saprospiraceae bacterium]|nr:hypothetical protein [Saprospiraceae bacterium]